MYVLYVYLYVNDVSPITADLLARGWMCAAWRTCASGSSRPTRAIDGTVRCPRCTWVAAPDGLHLHLLGPSSAVPKANPPGTRPRLTKSSFKRAPGAVLADSVPVAIAEGQSIPAAGSSVSFSGTAAVARDVDADPSFQDPEQVVRAICAHFFSGDGRAPAPAPANPSTAPLLRGDAVLLFELDRTSMRILQAR